MLYHFNTFFYLINTNKKKLVNQISKYKTIFHDIQKNDNYIKFKNITNNTKMYKGLENCIFRKEENDLCLYHFFVPKKVVGKNRILIGPKRDGGYVLMDDFEKIKIAYSFGISRDVSFDYALAKKNINIYMYDHTINALPFYINKFHWKKIGLTGNKTENKKLQTLEEILSDNGHLNETNMILKMDIEYSDWKSLLNISDEIIKKFKYILIEYHFRNEIKLYYKVLQKLQNTHQVFYIHCNNCGRIISFGNNTICNALEVSYIIKEGNKFEKDDSIYPIPEFDFKNCFGPKLNFNLNLLKFFDF